MAQNNPQKMFLEKKWVARHSSSLPGIQKKFGSAGWIMGVGMDQNGIYFRIVDNGDNRHIHSVVYSMEELGKYPELISGCMMMEILFA